MVTAGMILLRLRLTGRPGGQARSGWRTRGC
jgi:hypothetical protein